MSSIGSLPYSPADARQILRTLTSEDDPAFTHVAATLDPPSYPEIRRPMQPKEYRDLGGRQVAPPPKMKTFSSLKKKLGFGKSKAVTSDTATRDEQSKPRAHPSAEDLQQRYGIGSYDHFAGEAGQLLVHIQNVKLYVLSNLLMCRSSLGSLPDLLAIKCII